MEINKDIYKRFSVLDSLLSKLFSPLKGRAIKDKLLLKFLVLISLVHSIAVRIRFLGKFALMLTKINLNSTMKVGENMFLVRNINNLHYLTVPDEIYELSILRKLDLRGAVFDVGAYIGTHSFAFVDAGASRVISLEPNHYNFSLLSQNIRANWLEAKITPVEVAAFSEKGRRTFFESEEGGRSHSLANKPTILEKETEVPTDTLDNIKKSTLPNSEVSAIKIDVEGVELDVLKGAKNIIKLDRPHILFEALDKKSFISIQEYLQKQGYVEFYRINELTYIAKSPSRVLFKVNPW